ncbi:DUF418 domain-containing protein [Bacillaceae bacterium S4-13-56]
MDLQVHSEQGRLPWIDAARGFALFGILMVNVPAFNAPFFLYGGEGVYWDSKLDHIVQDWTQILFEASFYTLFSFLFGFGFWMMKEKLEQRTGHSAAALSRRFTMLIFIGLFHALFLWHGDILFFYGWIGFLLLFFYKRSNLSVGIWVATCFIAPTVLITFMLLLYPGPGYIDTNAIRLSLENYQSGTLFEVWSQNRNDWFYMIDPFYIIQVVLSILPMFLLGMIFARKKWLHDIELNYKILFHIWWVMGLLFLLFKLAPTLAGNPSWSTYIRIQIGGSASAIFYLLTIVLLYKKKMFQTLFKPLANMGRLSLTNYLSQSVICFFLFYSVGLGFYGRVTPLESVAFAVVIYLVQLILSTVWLKWFQMGPAEWVLRYVTYKSKPRFRNEKVS